MSQKFSLYEDLTVRREPALLRRHLRPARRAATPQRRAYVLEHGRTCAAARTTLTGKLSGGWKQRLALGCAMLHEPRAGLPRRADRRRRPGGAAPLLGPASTQLAAEGVTLFVTTHYMDEAEHCHRIAMHRTWGSSRARHGRRAEGASSPAARSWRSTAAAPWTRCERWIRCRRCEKTRSSATACTWCADARADDGGAGHAAARTVTPSAPASRIDPSLEDVFLHVVEAEAAADEEGAGRRRSRSCARSAATAEPDDSALHPGVFFLLSTATPSTSTSVTSAWPCRTTTAAAPAGGHLRLRQFRPTSTSWRPWWTDARRDRPPQPRRRPGGAGHPAGLGADAAAGRRTSLQILINGDNANTATTVLGYARALVSSGVEPLRCAGVARLLATDGAPDARAARLVQPGASAARCSWCRA